jgi:hypothetical protein
MGAALLVLLGLGLFVAGVLTGGTAYYWACVVACLGAAVLLFVARRRMAAGADAPGADATGGDRAARGDLAGDRTEAEEDSEPAAATPAPLHGSLLRLGAHGRRAAQGEPAAAKNLPDPPVEEVEVTDLLLVVDLKDEVYVVDERPRYHLAGCVHLRGHPAIPLPVDEARTDGFTPCAVCAPERNLAEQVRARKAAGNT